MANGKSVVRVGCLVVGIGALFGVLFATVRHECAVLACAYEIRELREDHARLRNGNDVLRADIAFRKKHAVLDEKAEVLDLADDAPAARVDLTGVDSRVRESGAD